MVAPKTNRVAARIDDAFWGVTEAELNSQYHRDRREKKKRGMMEEIRRQCGLCSPPTNITFNRRQYHDHKRAAHERRIVCARCRQSFTSNYYMDRHMCVFDVGVTDADDVESPSAASVVDITEEATEEKWGNDCDFLSDFSN